MKTVLSIHLGPVQDFILSARRCQDLWFGSWLLSELSKATAKGIASAGGASVIFPGAETQELSPGGRRNVANKILARVDGDLARAAEVAEAGRAAMQTRLRVMGTATFDAIGQRSSKVAGVFKREVAQDQLKELMEYFWAAAMEGEGGYAAARHEAERRLAARKNTQGWGQPGWAQAGVPKSSLDGVRESVLDERLYDPPFTADDRYTLFRLRGQERLCGIGLLKRNGLREGQQVSRRGQVRRWRERFFSTSHVAALPWLISLEDSVEAARAWVKLADSLDSISPKILDELDCVPGEGTGLLDRVDGAVLYEGRLRDTVKELGFGREVIDRAASDLRYFFNSVGRPPPQPYYAILHADGDRMGAVINAQQDFEAHHALSMALTAFAGEVPTIVEQHDGALIYAGGDDVLAFVPLHRVLDCAHKLADRFAALTASWQDEEKKSPSLSVGIAVAHHLTRMGDAVEVAREAEANAKRIPGKDALAVIVDKRAGAQVSVAGRRVAMLETLRPLIDLKRLDALSDKAAHELLTLDMLGEGADETDRKTLAAITHSEALRIIRRKRAERGQQVVAEATLARLETALTATPEGAGELARMLLVAEVFARAEDEAGVPRPSNPDTETEEVAA